VILTNALIANVGSLADERRYIGMTIKSVIKILILVAHSAAICSRWFLAHGFFYPEDGGDTFLRNVSSHKIYTAPYPTRRYSS
jgi:hypothetical protein